jgi:hypothetical protein
MLPLGGCIWSTECNMEFGHQIRTYIETKQIHGNSWSSWPVVGPEGCKLITSQQSGIYYKIPNVNLSLCICFILKNFPKLIPFYIWKSNKQSSEIHVNNVKTHYIPHGNQYVSIAKTKWLMFFREIIAVLYENHKYGQSEYFLKGETGGTYNYHCALDGYN